MGPSSLFALAAGLLVLWAAGAIAERYGGARAGGGAVPLGTFLVAALVAAGVGVALLVR